MAWIDREQGVGKTAGQNQSGLYLFHGSLQTRLFEMMQIQKQQKVIHLGRKALRKIMSG